MSRRRLFNVIGTLLYAVWVATIVASACGARRAVLETLSTPQARAEWEQWRSAAKALNENGPVKRRMPKSQEPPALVLMRDYFGSVLAAGVVLGSLVFGALAWLLHGVLVPRDRPGA